MKHFILLFSLLLTYPIATLQASAHSDSDHGYSADDDEADPATYPIHQDAERILCNKFKAKGAKHHARTLLKLIEDPAEQLQLVKIAASFSPSIHSNNDLKTLFDIVAEQQTRGNLLNFAAHVDIIRDALFYIDWSDGRPLKGKKMLNVLTSLHTITKKGFLCPATEMANTIVAIEPFALAWAKGILHTATNDCFLSPLAAKDTWTNELTKHLLDYIDRYKRTFEYKNDGRAINIMSIDGLFGAIQPFLEQSNTEILADTDPIGLPPIEEVDAALKAREASDGP